MPEDISNLENRHQITDNDYADLIVSYLGIQRDITSRYQSSLYQIIDQRTAIVYVPVNNLGRGALNELGYGTFPSLYGLLDTQALESSGVTRVQNVPNLALRGQGTLVGIIDTGIDYTNPIFQNADKTTRLFSIWDQTIESDNYPVGNYYGTVYSREQINEALKSEDPYSVVPSKDDNGHGTFMAGIAAGNADLNRGFSGAAPDSQIVVVKLKEAKPYIKEFFEIAPSVLCFQENDIMQGVNYLVNVARSEGKPISICVPLGSTQGSHEERGPLSEYMSAVGDMIGVAIVTAAGNEGNAGHHFFEEIKRDVGHSTMEIRVGENEFGFTIEIWGNAPNTYSVDITSPTGEVVPRIPSRINESRDIQFVFEPTTIRVDYQVVESRTGDQLILVRFRSPTAGIWRIRVYGTGDLPLVFHAWLPLVGFISPDTVFLNPDPYTTITTPGNASIPITATAYNYNNKSLYLNASRGYTRNEVIKPELAAPGVDVLGPLLDKSYSRKSGTSVSSAFTCGVSALLLEWGIVKKNYQYMDSIEVKKLLIRGAQRDPNLTYPNREWGYGILDLYSTFESLRGEIESVQGF